MDDGSPIPNEDNAVKRVSFLQSLEGLSPIEIMRRKRERNRKSNARRKKRLKALGIKSKYFNSTYLVKKKILRGRSYGFCAKCRGRFNKEELTIDHIIPVYDGGTFKKENLQMICRPCHDKKESEYKQSHLKR